MEKTAPVWTRNGYTLRLARAEEAEDYYRHGFCPLDPEAARLTGSKPVYTRQEVVTFFLQCVVDPNRYDFLLTGPDRRILGESVLNEIDWQSGTANYRILLFRPEDRGHGLGTWMVETARDFAFGTLKLRRLELNVFSTNPRAEQVYRAAGFRRTKILKNAVRTGEALADDILMVLEGEGPIVNSLRPEYHRPITPNEKEGCAMDFTHSKDYLMSTATRLLTTDSPSGFTHAAAQVAVELAEGLGYATRRSNKGSVIIQVPGRKQEKKIGLCAHIDTLGLMVRAITADGQLSITKIGGPILPTLDGEYCKIYTRDGRVYTGTILSLSPAAHVFEDAKDRPRNEETMAVRIDEKVKNADDVRALGIEVGDYVCFDPKTTVTESGFLKSRFIDDKGSASCLLTLLHEMKETGVKPEYDTEIVFTVYEEVGHGGATFPAYDELLAVDMGCVGKDLTCTEYQVSICAKDSAGPYDYELTSRLISLARENGVDYAVDVYPFYSSDVAVAWKSGNDVRAALIGPGVHASHGMERTHFDGMKATMELLALYLNCR